MVPVPMLQAGTTRPTGSQHRLERWFPLVYGLWLGLCLIKLGNPVVLDRLVPAPSTITDLIHAPWPAAWGVGLALPLVVLAALAFRPASLRPLWPFLAALAWFGWQWLAAGGTVESALTRAALVQFSVSLFCLAAGYYCLGRMEDLRLFWGAIFLAFGWVLWTGIGQRFGGLDAVRDWIYAQPDWRNLPPDYLKRIASNRIFSTFVYPNAFAGAILLLLPVLLHWLWGVTARLPRVARGVLTGLFAYAAVACLYWTGSKAGWLIAVAMLLVGTLGAQAKPRLKLLLLAAVAVLGLAGFLIKFSDYFRRGAPSVDARFDYWRAAIQVANRHPLLGSGPATFSVLYRQLKDPDSEMTRLVHNDYLEQAADAGWPAFIAYSAFIWGLIGLLYRERQSVHSGLALWLGCFAWATQSLVEFGLYIPASAWMFFTLLGLLAGRLQHFRSTHADSAG